MVVKIQKHLPIMSQRPDQTIFPSSLPLTLSKKHTWVQFVFHNLMTLDLIKNGEIELNRRIPFLNDFTTPYLLLVSNYFVQSSSFPR